MELYNDALSVEEIVNGINNQSKLVHVFEFVSQFNSPLNTCTVEIV